METALPQAEHQTVLHCSFCKKPEGRVKRIFGSPPNLVCDECVIKFMATLLTEQTVSPKEFVEEMRRLAESNLDSLDQVELFTGIEEAIQDSGNDD